MLEVPLRMEVAFLHVYVLLVHFCFLHGCVLRFRDVLKLAIFSRIIYHYLAIENRFTTKEAFQVGSLLTLC